MESQVLKVREAFEKIAELIATKYDELLENNADGVTADNVMDAVDTNWYNNGSQNVELTVGYGYMRIRTHFLGKVQPNMQSNEETYTWYERLSATERLATINGNQSRLHMLAFNTYVYTLTNTVRASADIHKSGLYNGAGNGIITITFDQSDLRSEEEKVKKVIDCLMELCKIKTDFKNVPEILAEYDNLKMELEWTVSRSKKTPENGLAAKIRETRNKDYDQNVIEEQINEYQNKIGNMLSARTWGWEIEAPNPGSDVSTPMGVEAGSDGSVQSYDRDAYEDCECECGDCTYHECDCGNCDDYNDSPDHCGDPDYCASAIGVEYRTIGGIPRAQHPGMLQLLNQIGDTEKNETAGTHIHVYAKDLSAEQVGVVLGGYALTQKIWDVIAGRNVEDDDRCKTYANLIPEAAIAYTIRSKKLQHVGKFTAINTQHIASDRGTLEFRQMNCNFDYKRITFMAWMARGLVEIAKRGAKIDEFFKIKNIHDFVELYAKHGYMLDKETDKIENPVGSRYNQSRNRIEVASV